MNQTLTPIEAGLYLKLDIRTIYRLAKNGLIPALKVDGRWRFNKAALEEWLSCGKTTLSGKNEATKINCIGRCAQRQRRWTPFGVIAYKPCSGYNTNG